MVAKWTAVSRHQRNIIHFLTKSRRLSQSPPTRADLVPLRGELNDLEEALKSLGSSYVSMPARGLDDEVIDQLFATEGFACPPELRAWYNWRNADGEPQHPLLHGGSGVFETQHNILFDSCLAMTLPDAFEDYRWWREEDGFPACDPGFHRGWLPIIGGIVDSGILCVDCVEQPGSVFLYDNHYESPVTGDHRDFEPLTEFVVAITRGIRDGWIVRSDQEGRVVFVEERMSPRDVRQFEWIVS